jgi:type VI secretion system secreted protein Hcp
MPVDMFLRLDELEGEAQDADHKGWVDVLAWSWGLSQSGTTHLGGGGGAGKVAVQDISFTKYVDSSSSDLILRCSDGRLIPTCDLEVRRAGSVPLVTIKMRLEVVLVTSVSTGGSGGEDRLTENVSLNFARYTFVYTPQNPDGTGGKERRVGWDITENVFYASPSF